MGNRATNKANKVVGYCRVSTGEQAQEGVSLKAQEASIRAYCAMKNLELEAMVIDAGISAAKPLSKRPGGQEVMALVKSKRVGHVVATKLDRLFRSAIDCLQVTDGWDRRGVAFHLLDHGGMSVDTSTPVGRFFMTFQAGQAEMERGLIAERTRQAMAHKKAKGQRVGQIPFGYQLASDGVHLEKNPDEQAVIEIVRELREGGLSLRKIVAHLNRDRVPSRGQKWHLATIQRITRRLAA